MSICGFQPYMCISAESGGAKKAIAWYKSVFSAQVKCALVSEHDPEKIGHAELAFGNSNIMISDAFPQMGRKTPDLLGGTPITLVLSMPGMSKQAFEKAVAEGAKVPENSDYKEQPWGWMAGTIIDPFGYQWMVGEDAKGWSNEETAANLGMKDIASEF